MENIKKITEIVINKDYIKRYSIFALALFIAAINYNLFIVPSNFVVGGTGGVAIVIKHFFGIEPSLTIFLLSFILVIFSYIFLDKENTMAAFFITVVYPLFVKVTVGIDEIFLISRDNLLLLAIFYGLIAGLSSGMIYKVGLNTGGFGVISKIISKKRNKSISNVNMIINFGIVLVGGLVFGFNMILYAYLILSIDKYISERILLGMSRNKTFYIISGKYQQIADFLMNDLKHDVTIFNTKGKFLGNDQKLVMSVIPTREYFMIKETIKSIDNKAFVTISDSYESKRQDITINTVNQAKKELIL